MIEKVKMKNFLKFVFKLTLTHLFDYIKITKKLHLTYKCSRNLYNIFLKIKLTLLNVGT